MVGCWRIYLGGTAVNVLCGGGRKKIRFGEMDTTATMPPKKWSMHGILHIKLRRIKMAIVISYAGSL